MKGIKNFKRSNRKYLALLMAALTAAASLSACSGSTSGDASQSSSAKTENNGSGAAGSVLRVGRTWDSGSGNFDPATFSGISFQFGPDVFESLLTYNDKQEPAPYLAESWETSDDLKTYTFKLREGVQFHYGFGEMKASDVVFSVGRLLDPTINNTATNSTNLGLANIESVEAADDYTVVFTLKEGDVFFPDKVARSYLTITSQKAVEEMGLEEYQKRPIGTGPFMLEEGGVPGEKYCTVKFDDYWGQKAKLDRVEYYVIPDDVTLANAMEAGEIDTYDVNNLEKVEEYMADPDTYVLLNARDSAQSYIGINANFEPLNDPKVREAIALSIDRDMVCDEYFKGTEEKSKGFLPTFCRYALEDYWNPEYNPEKAKQLLAEAGYPDGFAIDMYAPNDTLSAGPATLVQQFLTQIGLKVDLQTVDFGVWLDKAKAGEIPIYLFWDSCPVIPDNVLKQFTSESTINYIAYNDPEYDRIVAAAVEENDLAKKAELYNEAQKNIMDSGCLYTMTTYSIHQVVNPRVKDLKITTGLMLTCREAYIEE